jgi:hypothetical protein
MKKLTRTPWLSDSELERIRRGPESERIRFIGGPVALVGQVLRFFDFTQGKTAWFRETVGSEEVFYRYDAAGTEDGLRVFRFAGYDASPPPRPISRNRGNRGNG